MFKLTVSFFYSDSKDQMYIKGNVYSILILETLIMDKVKILYIISCSSVYLLYKA